MPWHFPVVPFWLLFERLFSDLAYTFLGDQSVEHLLLKSGKLVRRFDVEEVFNIERTFHGVALNLMPRLAPDLGKGI